MADEHEILDIQERMTQPASALRKYQDLVVGRRGLLPLLKFELLHGLLGGLPGAAGLLLRRLCYPLLLGRMGRGAAIGARVTLRHPHKIFLGDQAVIDDGCLLDAKGETNQGIRIGRGVFIGRNTILHCKNGDITIGDHANLGFNCDIASSNRVEIGAKVLIAAYTYVVGGGHDFTQPDVPVMDQRRVAHGIRIGDHAWIGAGVTVLDGVTVGEGAIIGTGAVVTEDLPAGAIAVGMPARMIRRRSAPEGGAAAAAQ